MLNDWLRFDKTQVKSKDDGKGNYFCRAVYTEGVKKLKIKNWELRIGRLLFSDLAFGNLQISVIFVQN